jgi:transcriptional regulator with XRE-family HTH domain
LDEKFTIGKKILQLAKYKAFTKIDFAKKMGVSRQTLDNWVNGLTSPNHNDMVLAAKILDVSISELTGIGSHQPDESTMKDSIIQAQTTTIGHLEKRIDDLARNNQELLAVSRTLRLSIEALTKTNT